MASSIYIGMISGTSMDAIDCALVEFDGRQPRQLDFINTEIPGDLRQKLLNLCEDHENQIPLLGETDVEFAGQLASAVDRILDKNGLTSAEIAAIGSHGQTIRHQPSSKKSGTPFTLQIGDPNTLAELTGITTVADFRRRDMAAGGEGAPIVPAFHRKIFSSQECDRIVLNVGGMANITVLAKDGKISGYDTGPANVLMDAWIHEHKGEAFDRNGDWAAGGEIDQDLLTQLLDEPYFALPAPKSTGRELFNRAWLNTRLQHFSPATDPQSIQATLLALTVNSISAAILQELSEGEIIVCGGGAHNAVLLDSLVSTLPGFRVMPSSALGVMPDSVEAVAFSWLARKVLAKEPVDFTAITGSHHPVLAGGVYYAR